MTRDRRGSASVDAAIVIPALLIFLALMIGGARIAMAQQAIGLSAQAGARAASLERTGASGTRAGEQAVANSLRGSDIRCDPNVTIQGDWTAPLGQPASARAVVTCHVPLSDLLIPGMPGTITVTKNAESPIDRYRSRR